MDNPVVLALVIAGVAALLLVPLVISLVKKNQRREELERRDTPVLEGDGAAETAEGTDAEAPGETPGESAGDATPDIVTVPAVEQPESIPSRMQRLRARLARSGGFGQVLLAILSRGDLSAADWEELEDTLIMADVGLDATSEIMEGLRSRVKIESTSDPQRVREILREELLRHVGPDMDRSLNLTRSEADSGAVHPAAVLMVGVNGTGKTTTVGKLARLLRAQGTTVLLGAADTFRAAAADQLVTWGDRVGVDVVRSDREGADPASVAFDAVAQADAAGVDVVIVDTAGRLQNKAGLMDELGKIKRVMERTAPVNEVLLVLDATTGQNGMQQARVFAEVTGLTGIVLTKLDGTAKGGIVISVQRELGVPVKLVGLGEGPDDLAPFDPEGFVDSLLS
ncbi:signal recognition particle-docking protein FtsY [Actinotignum schaalii]|uniref:signal recognition particle-docking protein FtsY n=1 Tax=Actinotignum schaalii TaxID=59505 RepID=UPI00040CCD70|nr:signal recognition particle-docking protein FtsY [Actinotignum schaalii]AIE82007.1 cell division protein FtsY [Actinotignum schaalii]WQN45681.1 signal recognition particle-docking protein FtsY [Actinotignum schaalii]